MMETVEEPAKTVKRRRSQAEKVGRLQYIIQLLHHLERRLDQVDARTRTIYAGLKDILNYEQDYIRKVMCQDEVDQAILNRLIEVGDAGIQPKQLIQDLARFRLAGWDISRRVKRMNKRLKKEIGEEAIEKRGWKLALTHFMHQALESEKEEVKPYESTSSGIGT